jgi:hypothetical protein
MIPLGLHVLCARNKPTDGKACPRMTAAAGVDSHFLLVAARFGESSYDSTQRVKLRLDSESQATAILARSRR